MSRPTVHSATNGKTLSRRSDRFLAGLADFDRVSFISHVHPDPDSMGSMMGLAHMVGTALRKPIRFTIDGQVCRAENRAMVDLLNIQMEQIDSVVWGERDALVMVDSQPKTGRHSIDPTVPIYAVIDHHQTPGDLENIPFTDIRRSFGATCSLVTRYLVEQDMTIPKRVATALYYGIETEVSGCPREAHGWDDDALHFLFPLADQNILAKIRNAPLPQTFFECFLQALQSSFIYDRLLISWVNELHHPELAAQIVDFLIRYERVDWAMCAGVHGDQMVLSVRTGIPRAQAGEILRRVVRKLGGRAGGHDRRAGGFVPLPSTSATSIEQVQSELRKRLLKALHIDECRGQRLVARRDMLQNIQA